MNEDQLELLDTALHYLDHCRECADQFINFADDEAMRNASVIDLLQFLRSAQYSIEAALADENMEDDELYLDVIEIDDPNDKSN